MPSDSLAKEIFQTVDSCSAKLNLTWKYIYIYINLTSLTGMYDSHQAFVPWYIGTVVSPCLTLKYDLNKGWRRIETAKWVHISVEYQSLCPSLYNWQKQLRKMRKNVIVSNVQERILLKKDTKYRYLKLNVVVPCWTKRHKQRVVEIYLPLT